MEWSKLLSWEVQNFASIEHGKCEFDESGIILLKGYNDSGKSNMFRALDVLMFNAHPKNQTLFIMDGKDFFRVTAKFSDGVVILRDKYINGQSLYEMWKDGQCLYTSKVNNVLTKIDSVPEPIVTYLGVSEDLTIRTCYDKQFVVQTSGSENYRVMSSELRTEELVKAGELINNDKNKLAMDISAKRSYLLIHQGMLESGENLSEELVSFMERGDKNIDTLEMALDATSDIEVISENIKGISITPELQPVDMTGLNELDSMIRIGNTINQIPIYPELQSVDDNGLGVLKSLVEVNEKLCSLVIPPELRMVDSDGLRVLSDALGVSAELQDIKIAPELSVINNNRLSDIESLLGLKIDDKPVQPELSFVEAGQLKSIEDIYKMSCSIPDLEPIDSEISRLKEEMQSLAHQAGDSVVICPECGYLITDTAEHAHS